MKRLPFVALGLALSAAVTVCLAQQPPSAPEPTGTTTGFLFVPPTAAPANEQAPLAEAADAESLRTRLMELLKQKADLMTAAELQSALTQAEQDLQELRGSRRLDEARQLLEQITQDHPRTKASQKAELILRYWESSAPSTSQYSNPI